MGKRTHDNAACGGQQVLDGASCSEMHSFVCVFAATRRYKFEFLQFSACRPFLRLCSRLCSVTILCQRAGLWTSRVSHQEISSNLKLHISHRCLNSVASVRTRTIPTERPPTPVGEVSTNFFADRGVSRGQRNGSPQPLISVF